MELNFKILPWNKRMEILRTLKGWTQQEMAEKCNTNQKVYWNWESGNAYPRKNSKNAIAKAFDVMVEDIFGEEA